MGFKILEILDFLDFCTVLEMLVFGFFENLGFLMFLKGCISWSSKKELLDDRHEKHRGALEKLIGSI